MGDLGIMRRSTESGVRKSIEVVLKSGLFFAEGSPGAQGAS